MIIAPDTAAELLEKAAVELFDINGGRHIIFQGIDCLVSEEQTAYVRREHGIDDNAVPAAPGGVEGQSEP